MIDDKVIGNAVATKEESQWLFNPDVLGLLHHERVELRLAIQKVSADELYREANRAVPTTEDVGHKRIMNV